MSASTNAILGIAFVVIGLTAAALQAWLWRFPMAPDPTGKDPNGVSTAPRSWTHVHRLLGYTFAAIYLVLMSQMVPRLWNYDRLTGSNILHAVLGVAIGLILIAKIAIIRRYHRFGHRLPYFGGSIAALAVLTIALVIGPATRLSSLGNPTPAQHQPGREAAIRRCTQCHGSSTVLEERRTLEDWREIAEEMHERAERRNRPLTEPEAMSAAEYLFVIHGEAEKAEKDRAENKTEEPPEDEDKGRRRRRRGRDH